MNMPMNVHGIINAKTALSQYVCSFRKLLYLRIRLLIASITTLPLLIGNNL